MEVTIRRLAPDDDLVALTGLLHRAYARLAAAGLNFTATDQSVEVTRSRCSRGPTWVAVHAGVIVGTITLNLTAGADDPAVYREPGVASFGQFGVEPSWSGHRIGERLLAVAMDEARRAGFTRLACDTAAPAEGLLHYYERLGFREVARHQWGSKTYESCVLVRRTAKLK